MGFPEMGLTPQIIHFRLGFSMKSTIHGWGTPAVAAFHIVSFAAGPRPRGPCRSTWKALDEISIDGLRDEENGHQ